MINFNNEEFNDGGDLRDHLSGHSIWVGIDMVSMFGESMPTFGEKDVEILKERLIDHIVNKYRKVYCGLEFSTKEELVDLLRKQPLSYKDSRLTLLDVTIVTALGVNDIEQLKETIISIIVNKMFLCFVYKVSIFYGTKAEIKEQVFKKIGEEIDNL